MLTHLRVSPVSPERVVVIGAGGFVGGAIADHLELSKVPTLRVTRVEVDLLAADATERLARLLREGDSVVAVAAIAPCKTPEMLRDNVVLGANIVRALATKPLAHVVNIGSDAVFEDSSGLLSEGSKRAPGSYHGVMHLAREVMFEAEVKAPVATLRPTLIYGARDPHNGYGPNQFRRKANKGDAIVLFGEGEERRDHVSVNDVAELTARVLLHVSTGSLNVATGVVTSFRDAAQFAVELSGQDVAISGSLRKGPMPHNGYRAFNAAASKAAFPDFSYTSLAQGMRAAQQAEFGRG